MLLFRWYSSFDSRLLRWNETKTRFKTNLCNLFYRLQLWCRSLVFEKENNKFEWLLRKSAISPTDSHGLVSPFLCMCLGTWVCVYLCDCYFRDHMSYLGKIKNEVYKCLCLPTNGAIGNVILHKLDLLFQCQIYQMSISRKRWELAQKCVIHHL